MILTIARRELRSLFLSPLAWVILGVVTFILGWLFLARLDVYLGLQSRLLAAGSPIGVTEAVGAALFGNAAVVLLLVVPLITMRLVSEERRNRTLSLLFSAPVSMTEIVLGKYLGILGFLAVVVILVALMPLSLLAGGQLDFGMLGSGILGLALLLAAFAAVGLFMSTLTQYPTIAAVATFGVLLLSWVLDWSGGGASSGVLGYLSLLNHYEPFLKGVFDSSDAAFNLLFATTFVILSIRRLDADRLGG
jgi:ABC-2 type transport system permease protein